jgi:hypothetical protein
MLESGFSGSRHGTIKLRLVGAVWGKLELNEPAKGYIGRNVLPIDQVG